MLRSLGFFSFLALALLALLAAPALAQTPVNKTASQASIAEKIEKIDVLGLQRFEPQTVLSYLTLAVGDAYDAERANQSLKALFATGLFADVSFAMAQGTLKITVSENPILNRVVFEGNDAAETEDLTREVRLKPRMAFTRTAVQNDVQRLLDLYRRQGRFGAQVEPKIIELEQNRVDLVFEIAEGPVTGIQSIRFIGNQTFEEGDLRSVISTRETAWWRVFSTSDFYDPDRLTFDRELLRRFYLNEGYADFRVLSAAAELTPDRRDFIITFTVEEGERYQFGEIELTSELKGLEPDAVREALVAKSGDWYSAEAVETSINQLVVAGNNLEFPFVAVVPKVDKKTDDKKMNVNFVVKEGDRVFVNRITISGNQRTLDRVVRRELQLAEADPFTTEKLRISEQKIRDLGFFGNVSITPQEGPQPDQVDLTVALEEKPTGELGIGAGFSTTDGLLGDFSIRERNLMGRGQDLRLGFTISSRSQQLDLSFTEPYFLGRDLAAGFDVFRVTRDVQDESAFDQRNTGFALRLGYPLSERLRQRVSYTLSATDIENVPSTASRFIREQEGSTISSIIGQEISYDARDSKLEPTSGYVLRAGTDVAGLGGDVSYMRNKLSGATYYSPSEDVVFTLSAEGGYIFGIKDAVRINDRFYLGGETLRGFRFAGVGPRDLTNDADDSLGGTIMGRGTLELTLPSGLPEDLGVRTHIFTDVGTLTDPNVTALAGEDFRDEASLRQAVGVGVSWQSPFGPIRLNFAIPLLKEEYDVDERFSFSFGTRF